ncbi:MAG TPA: DNA repair protein RecO [Jatrophihabitans sp.]|nr:DNA repair protein RecO [Jatrophihabitans sp.]
MPLYRDEAVVLRVHKLGEADRIVTLLTKRHGRVRAVGKGVRRTTSRYGARLEPGSHIDVQLHTRTAEPDPDRGAVRHNTLDLITQVESVRNYGAGLASDYQAWTAAVAICETAERLTPEEGEPALRQFLLLAGALRSLADREHASGLVLDAFLIRSLSLAGWEPALAECAICSAPGPHAAFHVPSGGSVCPTCRPGGSVRPHPDSLGLVTALLGGDWDTADAAADPQRREASGLIAAHLQWHLERGIRSLPLVDR